jgi:hypothetical protein
MSSRGKKIYKQMTDIQKLERDKRKKKREEIHNMWNNQNSNRKIVGEDHPDRACEQSESDMNRPDLEITTVATTPDRSNEVQLIEASMGTHQLEDQPKSMDYEDSGPTICTPPVQVTSPQIKEFLQQRLQIDEQSARLWYRTDEHGNIHDTLIVEPEINLNKVDNMLIHIKDLTDTTPLPDLISKEHNNLVDYSHEPTRSLE